MVSHNAISLILPRTRIPTITDNPIPEGLYPNDTHLTSNCPISALATPFFTINPKYHILFFRRENQEMMRFQLRSFIKFIGLGFTLALILSAQYSYSQNQQALQLVRALEVVYHENTNPSGLAFCGNKLLTVSDKHDHIIFEIQIKSKTAELVPYLQLTEIPAAPAVNFPNSIKVKQIVLHNLLNRKFDWEGISCDNDNNIYLASEAMIAVAKVSAQNKLQWLNLNLYHSGQKKVLFNLHNAFIEGITWAPSKEIFILAERSQRGLISLRQSSSGWRINKIQPIPESNLDIARVRSMDFTGASYHRNKLYTLERNLFSVCRRDPKSFAEEQCWSYQHIETDEKYKYNNTKYGTAEGIASDPNYIFIILDNNEKRRTATNSTNPQLLIFAKPNNWSF